MELEDEWHGRCLAPLLPRLDRLDSLMEYLERKQSLPQRSDGMLSPPRRWRLPLDLALDEARAKGSVLHRVAALERRLAQLSLEMEASSVSSSSTVHTLGSPSMRQESSNIQQFASFQNFDGRIPKHQDCSNHRISIDGHNLLVQIVEQQEVKNSATGHLVPDVRDSIGARESKKKKHRTLNGWRCKRLLGC